MDFFSILPASLSQVWNTWSAHLQKLRELQLLRKLNKKFRHDTDNIAPYHKLDSCYTGYRIH